MIDNHITQLITQLQSREYDIRYPQLYDKSQKTHVLFLGPYLNATGLYRTILPYMQLNRSTTHAAIINQLIPNTLKNRNGVTEWYLSDPMIEWADIIVFPTVTDDLTQNIKLLRQINKKPHLKFVFDIDDNYHIDQPGQDTKLATQSREALLKNMSMCQIVTCTNAYLGNFYLQLLHISQKNNTTPTLPTFLVMPNFMSFDYMENIKITEPKPTKIRIGMVLNRTQNQFNDIFSIRKTLLNMQKKHKDKIELYLFGWNGRIIQNGNTKDALKDVKYKYIEPVQIYDYFNQLSNLQLDFALMPLLQTEFNACKSHHKLLQYAQMGIPTIVSDVLPYNEIIAPEGKSMFESNYLPALKCKTEEDWTKNIDYLIENTEARKNISNKAQTFVNEHYTWQNKPSFATNVYK